jgi:hypothetical protein
LFDALEIVLMSDKRKMRARALAAKTGMSYQAAINALAAGATPKQEKTEVTRTLEQLLTGIPAPTTFGVSVVRAPAVGASADLEVATEQSRFLAEHPQYIAESGRGQMVVSREEMDVLLASGAADDGVQMIRSFKHGVTFSGRCSHCDRFIWCGDTEHAGRCFCGRGYRVVLDGAPDWTLPQGIRCMDCGDESRLRETRGDRSPWVVINQWQMRCAWCAELIAHRGDLHVKTDGRGRRVVRYTSQNGTQEVEAFVAENNITVDWSKAFVSSLAETNFRGKFEFWEVPVLEPDNDAGGKQQ